MNTPEKRSSPPPSDEQPVDVPPAPHTGDMPEEEIDEALVESFPASDPPSWTLGTDHRVETEGEETTGTSP